MSKTNETSVLYNASCPICRREIDHYRAYVQRTGSGVTFDDLNGTNLTRWGLDADTAARRIYVMKNGELISGMDAFRALWSEMPRYRILAWFTNLPGLRQGTHWIYENLAAPWLYRKHLKRQAKKLG
ncbi:MAG: DUF393 domain-containing protein [Aliishimia sp.]